VYGLRPGGHEDIQAGGRAPSGESEAKRLADPPASPIPSDRATNGPRRHDRESRLQAICAEQAGGERGPLERSAVAAERRYVAGAPQARGTRHVLLDQTTMMRLRPRARRADRTFRPPVVFMRARKPCTRARRRVFG